MLSYLKLFLAIIVQYLSVSLPVNASLHPISVALSSVHIRSLMGIHREESCFKSHPLWFSNLLIIFLTSCWKILPRSLRLLCPKASLHQFICRFFLKNYEILKHTLDLVLCPLERSFQPMLHPALSHNTIEPSSRKNPGVHLTHQHFSTLHTLELMTLMWNTGIGGLGVMMPNSQVKSPSRWDALLSHSGNLL